MKCEGRTFTFGTEPAGVYEWIDRQRWQPVGDVWSIAGSSEWFYPVPTEAVHVRHIAVEPDDPQTIYSAIQVGGEPVYPAHLVTVVSIPRRWERCLRTARQPRD